LQCSGASTHRLSQNTRQSQKQRHSEHRWKKKGKRIVETEREGEKENCSSDEERSVSDTSMDATMEVEPGMESPPHLHPKINKNSGTKIFSAS